MGVGVRSGGVSVLESVWVLVLGSVQRWRLGLVSTLWSGRGMQVSELELVLGL